jgi:hypothetical protein
MPLILKVLLVDDGFKNEIIEQQASFSFNEDKTSILSSITAAIVFAVDIVVALFFSSKLIRGDPTKSLPLRDTPTPRCA